MNWINPRPRAWDITRKVMFDVAEMAWLEGGLHITDGASISGFVGKGFILMDPIGIRDRNGKNIYEEDKIKVKYEDLLGIEKVVVGVVEIDKLMVNLDFPHEGISVALSAFYTNDPEDFEVVGNACENPEMYDNGENA